MRWIHATVQAPAQWRGGLPLQGPVYVHPQPPVGLNITERRADGKANITKGETIPGVFEVDEPESDTA